MKELPMFGMPVALNPEDNRLCLGDGVSFTDYSRKLSKGMFGLLADSSYKKEGEPYYDFYKALGRKEERQRFLEKGLRYDAIVIMEGSANGEFKKTAGHFHCQSPGAGMSYPELYQVIKGTALFVLQKVDDYEKEDGKMVVQDAILAEVKAGQAIVIPPDYGHNTVNIGNEPMVFVDLVADCCSNAYDGVKRSGGMCCYIMKNNDGSYRVEKNPQYDFPGEPRVVQPVDSPVLGLKKNVPAYTAFLKDREKFQYLLTPQNNVQDYFAVFKDQ